MLSFDKATYLSLLFKFISKIEQHFMRIRCFTIHRIHKHSTHSILYLKGAESTLVEKVTVINK